MQLGQGASGTGGMYEVKWTGTCYAAFCYLASACLLRPVLQIVPLSGVYRRPHLSGGQEVMYALWKHRQLPLSPATVEFCKSMSCVKVFWVAAPVV